MCNLMCLHNDYMQWIVNPMTEINVDALVDPEDTETYPGKEYLVRDNVNGQQNIRTVNRRSNTNDVLANMQYADQNYQRGSFVTDAVQGLPGYRKDMTYREAAMNLDQALGVYSLMGENIEQGAIGAIVAAVEFIRQYARLADYRACFAEEEAAALFQSMGIQPDENPDNLTGLSGLPPVDGSFHVSGIQALMKENEALTNIKQVIIPLAESARFGPYIRPYRALKAIELRTSMADEGVIVTEQEARQIEAQQYAALAAQQEAAARAQELQEAHSMADLAGKADNLTQPGLAPARPVMEAEA
jgi:hypothetical protein